MPGFAETIATAPYVITDGGIETRIMYETDLPLDGPLEVAGLVHGGGRGREAMRRIYRDYLEVGRRHDVPMVIGTPTFRAHPDRMRAAGIPLPDGVAEVNGACVSLHQELRREMGDYGAKVFIAGVIGPRGDAYRPQEAPGADAAADYHAAQARALAASGVDFLFAPAFPAAPEARGVARAMAATGLPHVLSFVLGGDGRLLDGSTLDDVIAAIDAAVTPSPLYYSLSCIHSAVGAAALAGSRSHRIRGLKANGSRLPPEELVKLDHLDSEPPATFAEAMLELHRSFGLSVLGGCCGTGPAHIDALAGRLAQAPGF